MFNPGSPEYPVKKITTRLDSLAELPLESIVCYFHSFENNLGIEQKFK